MENITVGKFVPSNSIFNKLNPLVKLIINITFIILVFIANNIIILSSIVLLTFLFFLVSGLRKKQLWKMLIPVLVISSFLFLVNLFLITDGYADTKFINYDSSGNGFFWSKDKFVWWEIHLTDKVVFRTLFIGARIYVMIIITTLLTSTTKPTALTKAIEQLLCPLKLIFVPVHIIAMIISIALRFIPTLLEEAQRIMKAQASRGVDFKNGNIKSKAKSVMTLVIPLFVSAFSKAEDLGNAMETRGYDPYEKRTRYRVYPIDFFDFVAFMIIVGLTTLIVMNNINFFDNPVWFI